VAKCGCAGASGSVGVADTPSIDLQLLNGIINAALKLDPAPGNLLEVLATGLRLDCADVAACVSGAAQVTVADSPGIDFSSSGAGIPGDPRVISGDTKAVFAQTSSITFTRNLTAANDVLETVTELPALTLTVPGLYIAEMEVNGVATNAGSSAAVSTSVSAYLLRDGTLVPNTETRLSNLIQGTAGGNPAEPALGSSVTGSATRAVFSDGTTQLRIAASSVRGVGSTASINSNAQGRTRITAWRIGA
jgi:hypothetical protein